MLVFNIGLQVVWAKCALEDAGGGVPECEKGGGGGGGAIFHFRNGTAWEYTCYISVGPNSYSGQGSYGVGSGSGSSSRQNLVPRPRTINTHVCQSYSPSSGVKNEGCAPGNWHHSPNPWCNDEACFH